MPRLNIRHCRLADEEHGASRRQYAHIFHHARTICVSRAFFKLPETHRLGILLHECGHHILPNGGENEVTQRVIQESGIKIWYKDSKWGDQLEWIAPRDKKRAREWLGMKR